MKRATLEYDPANTARPYRVVQGIRRARSFATVEAAAAYMAQLVRPARPPRQATPAPSYGPALGDSPMVEPRRYRVVGSRGPVTVSRDLTARGKGAAVRIFVDATGCDRIVSIRTLRRGLGRAVRAKRVVKNDRTANLRRRESAYWTRTLQRSGILKRG